VYKDTEAIDYYILFRDIEPFPVSILAFLAEDDNASYVWSHVGKLTDGQAESVRDKLDSKYREKFVQELNNSFNTTYPGAKGAFAQCLIDAAHASKIVITPYHPEAWNFLTDLSPVGFDLVRRIHGRYILECISANRDTLEHLPLDDCTLEIPPMPPDEMEKILNALKSFPQNPHDPIFSYKVFRPDNLKKHRSFVELIPSIILDDIWQRNCMPYKGLSRYTTTIWLRERQQG
jgi:hypothetical protein